MATSVGTDALVKVGDVTVADLASWSVNDDTPAITGPVFGDGNQKVHGMGIRVVTGEIAGYLNVDDSTGQTVIRTAYEDKTQITNLMLYINATDYWSADTGVYITSMPNSAAVGEIIPVSFSFEVNGGWTLTQG